jgi:hypothetical protein
MARLIGLSTAIVSLCVCVADVQAATTRWVNTEAVVPFPRVTAANMRAT